MPVMPGGGGAEPTTMTRPKSSTTQTPYSGAGAPYGLSALIPGAWGAAMGQYQDQMARQQYGLGMAGLGLSGQELGLQRGDLGAQLAYLTGQYGLSQQGFGLQSQQLGLQRQGLAQQATQARRSSGESIFRERGAQAAGGAMGSPGERMDIGDIRNQLAVQLADIGRAGKGLDIQQKQLGLSEKGAALGFNRSKAQLALAEKNLGIQAKRLGLSGTQLKDQLQNALAQSGLSSLMSVYDLGNMLGSQDLQQSQAAYSILYGAMSPMIGGMLQGQTAPPQ